MMSGYDYDNGYLPPNQDPMNQDPMNQGSFEMSEHFSEEMDGFNGGAGFYNLDFSQEFEQEAQRHLQVAQ